MSGLTFAGFFLDVHGVPPLPWQERLATQLIENHTWPDLIDLPTASGKTACIDIALFHLAWCAKLGEPWRAARRIVFVVDRRIIVDTAAERAERLQVSLEESRTDSVRRVADALKQIGGTTPLMCQKLRGGMPRERGFALDPAQPMVVTSTVDQVGSRLLFRGYGLSSYTWPIHAGLLAYDTLLLIDEAHLSVPFTETIAAVRREQARAEKPPGHVQPVRVVTLSATARTKGARFQLDDQDLAHPRIAERRMAPKPARLIETSNKPAERLKALSSETLAIYRELSAQAPAIALIVNRVRTARALYEVLHAEAAKADYNVELLIGRSRPLDRDEVARRVMARAGSGRDSADGRRGLIVVATQTIEVGADLDFQGLVTECAAFDALRQRFGRLDRLGVFRRARAAIIGGGEAEDDPVYGPALNQTWRWLNAAATTVGGCASVDFSIEAIGRAAESVDFERMTAQSRPALKLTPTHVDLLCQTSPSPMYDPDIQAFLHGLDSSPPDIQLLWRADLPLTGSGAQSALDAREPELAQRLLELNAPSSLEALALPLPSVRAWLSDSNDSATLSDVEGAIVEDNKELRRPSRQILRRHLMEWTPVFARDLQPGDTVVAPTSYGGCDEFGFAPESKQVVSDLSTRARQELKKSAQLVITPQWLALAGVDEDLRKDVWRTLIEQHRSQKTAYELLQILLDGVGDGIVIGGEWLRSDPIVEVLSTKERVLYAIVATSGKAEKGDISDEDLSSSHTVPVSLREHNAGVGRRARKAASAVGLNTNHVENLGCAGDLHDIGKADPRFQRLLRASDDQTLQGELLAKGSRHSNVVRVELGERHEAYSVALLQKHPELLSSTSDPELVLYLIGVHHGRGRALMPDRSDDGVEFTLELKGREYSFEGAPHLSALGSGWPSLFWRLNRRYGPWGLAYLEAVLRLADWMRSEEELRLGDRQ